MFTFKEAFKHYLFKVNTKRLYDTLMMVIVCTSTKNKIHTQTARNLLLVLPFYFPSSFISLMHKRRHFSYFSFIRLI
jgi:hypothetical protein